MNTLANAILERAAGLPEGAPIHAKELLHLGNRAAVDQALSRLARRELLLRVGRGVYVRPVKSRFGVRAPDVSRVVELLADVHGETIAPHGAGLANKLGLTPQVPTRTIYLTSGRSRRLRFGAQVVELRHAPRWQVALGAHPAGDVLGALAWLGRERAGDALRLLRRRLTRRDLNRIAAARPVLPSWLAEQVSAVVVNG